ncbi:MAG TPA: sulfatase [Thermoplasmata archaeon]|nr:sulfatase [Thermoplasmata archaeon]
MAEVEASAVTGGSEALAEVGAASPPGRPPDVLIVVLDCVRADLFRAEVEREGRLPFLSRLRREAIVFPGAVSPGSWTIPSHASLFTGLYPWDHGAHSRTGPILTPGPETIAEVLGRAGYATALYSGNAYVQSATGLARGFDETLWGGSREFFLRFLGFPRATCPDLGSAGPVHALPPGRDRPSRFGQFAIDALSRAPALWDGLNRVGAKVRGTYGETMRSVSPWIEGTVDAWLTRQPPERPVFLFVNLIEAHEPYLADAGLEVGARRWLGYARARQDSVLWVKGRWKPTPTEVASSRASYVRSLQTLDRRVEGIVRAFARHGRWDGSLFVLTSDHGQAFLEQGTIYHRFRVDEPIARIPLWVRAPGGRGAGERPEAWASLIDVPRTIAALVGRESFGDPSSRSLLESDAGARERPVYSMTDGIRASEIPAASAEWKAFLDRLEVAAYRGSTKAVAHEDGRVDAYRVAVPDLGAPPVRAEGDPDAAELAELARRALELAAARIASQPYHGSVEQRIAGWGY